MLHAEQVRAARALLGWRQEDLAKAAKVGIVTVRKVEAQDGPMTGNISTLRRIQESFEQAGIRFLDDDESGGIGVRLQKRKR